MYEPLGAVSTRALESEGAGQDSHLGGSVVHDDGIMMQTVVLGRHTHC